MTRSDSRARSSRSTTRAPGRGGQDVGRHDDLQSAFREPAAQAAAPPRRSPASKGSDRSRSVPSGAPSLLQLPFFRTREITTRMRSSNSSLQGPKAPRPRPRAGTPAFASARANPPDRRCSGRSPSGASRRRRSGGRVPPGSPRRSGYRPRAGIAGPAPDRRPSSSPIRARGAPASSPPIMRAAAIRLAVFRAWIRRSARLSDPAPPRRRCRRPGRRARRRLPSRWRWSR